jgi:hypothetical protein
MQDLTQPGSEPAAMECNAGVDCTIASRLTPTVESGLMPGATHP